MTDEPELPQAALPLVPLVTATPLLLKPFRATDLCSRVSGLSPTRLVDLEVGQGDAQQGRVETALLAAADEIADDVIALGAAAGNEVALHRGGKGGAAGRQHLARALDRFRGWRMAVGGGDAHAGTERLLQQPLAQRRRQDLADIGAGGRAGGGGGGQ